MASVDSEVLERCIEDIAATVLDGGEPMSYRTLGASARVHSDVSRHALRKFADDNASAVGTLDVVVELGTTDASTKATPVDPRARVIRIASLSPAPSADKVLSRQIYSVYKKPSDDANDDPSATVEAISIACWSRERALRNDIFEKVDRQAPLSLAIKAFYESGIKCTEATTRTGFGDSQGEESVTVFDSVKAAKKPIASISTSQSANGAKASFFKSSSSASTASKARTASTPTSKSATTPAKQPTTKKIDATSMSKVFTIDSDDDEDEDDGDAPVFVKKASSGTAKPRSKRVISDDEDDDEDMDASRSTTKVSARSTKSSASSSSARNVKRKLSASPDEKKATRLVSEDVDAAASQMTDETKHKDRCEKDGDEEEAAVAVPTKRRVEITKTRINEQGYMVTEKTYEEVELTAEEIEQERVAAAKRKKAAAAARAAAEAKAAAAEKKAKKSSASGGGSSSGPAKQKNLFAFFNRK